MLLHPLAASVWLSGLLAAEAVVLGDDCGILVRQNVVFHVVHRLSLLQGLQSCPPMAKGQPQSALSCVHTNNIDSRPVLGQAKFPTVDFPPSDLIVRNCTKSAHDLMNRGTILSVGIYQSLNILQDECSWLVGLDVTNNAVEDARVGSVKARAGHVQHGKVLARETGDIYVEIPRKHPGLLGQQTMRYQTTCKEVRKQGLRRAILHNEFTGGRHDVTSEHVVDGKLQVNH
mmetsp:Transcript_2557/g.6109  ORF Transcript_2557/g.6109 Transcript_2557/m.6109 type:complete len:230 (-) Transcript_2557:21-710(-)